MVLISENNSNFIGSDLIKTIKTGVLETDLDTQTYFLSSQKNENSELQHKLNIKIIHYSSKKRKYLTANLCDKWMRCDGNEQKLVVISSNASNCLTNGCDYQESMNIPISNELLTSRMEDGFTIKINTKRGSSKIKVPSAYIKGFLKVANKKFLSSSSSLYLQDC